MVSMSLEKPICAPPHLSKVPPTLPLKQFQCSSDWGWPSLVLWWKIVWLFLSLHASLLRATDGVMFLALCPHIVSQAPQHVSSSVVSLPASLSSRPSHHSALSYFPFCNLSLSLHVCVFARVRACACVCVRARVRVYVSICSSCCWCSVCVLTLFCCTVLVCCNCIKDGLPDRCPNLYRWVTKFSQSVSPLLSSQNWKPTSSLLQTNLSFSFL